MKQKPCCWRATSDYKTLAVNEALEKFVLLDPQKAEVVKLRYLWA